MKRIIYIAAAIVAVAVMFFAFRHKEEVYPYVFADNTPSAIPVSHEMPLNFKIFREFKNERVTVKVYSGKSKEDAAGKEPEAVFVKDFEKKGDTIGDVRFTWGTPDIPGDYVAEYYSSRLIGDEWQDSDEKLWINFSVVYPCEVHTFEENEDSVYGTEGIKSDCYTHGTAYRFCTVCGYEELYELELSHVYGGSMTISNASCKDTGYKTYECTKCAETKVEVIEADTDKHSIRAVVKVEPTATRPGSVWFECSKCNYVEPYQTEIPALFMDINPAMYYEIPVSWAYDNDYFGRIRGYEFVPDAECSRAIAISLMYLANGVGVTHEDVNPFTDVSEGDFFRDAAKWAYKYDVVEGTEFKPYEYCTRAMLVEYLWRMEGSPRVRTAHKFTDIPEDASYNRAVSWAVYNGIVSGVEEGIFGPDLNCTQAQVVTFLYRILGED